MQNFEFFKNCNSILSAIIRSYCYPGVASSCSMNCGVLVSFLKLYSSQLCDVNM